MNCVLPLFVFILYITGYCRASDKLKGSFIILYCGTGVPFICNETFTCRIAINRHYEICYRQFTCMNILPTFSIANLLFLRVFFSSIKWQLNIDPGFKGISLNKTKIHKSVHLQLIESYQQDTTVCFKLTCKIWAVACYGQCPDTATSI